ncbi:MAG: hypothetical protein LH478_10310 [Chitinophagaceae bacterium]|nr:hypothetical protein [Chitinophagaceae bacterium]
MTANNKIIAHHQIIFNHSSKTLMFARQKKEPLVRRNNCFDYQWLAGDTPCKGEISLALRGEPSGATGIISSEDTSTAHRSTRLVNILADRGIGGRGAWTLLHPLPDTVLLPLSI